MQELTTRLTKQEEKMGKKKKRQLHEIKVSAEKNAKALSGLIVFFWFLFYGCFKDFWHFDKEKKQHEGFLSSLSLPPISS